MKDLQLIDYVIPYVDSSIPRWIQQYKKYSCESNYSEEEFSRRFLTNRNFKYVFRGIEKFLPWINNIILIVQDETQIPDWIKPETVKIIRHDQFIPSVFLPTFNSNTIECFLHNIKELQNFFIYSNDDCYIMDYCNKEDFFCGQFPRNNIRWVNSENDSYSKKMMRINNIIKDDIGEFFIAPKNKKDGYFTTFHIQQPFSKRIYRDIFNHFKNIILKSIKRFRDDTTISQFLFSLYFIQLSKGKYINNNLEWKYFNLRNNYNSAIDFLKNPNKKLVCLNNGDEQSDQMVYEYFNRLFPNKSRYEK